MKSSKENRMRGKEKEREGEMGRERDRDRDNVYLYSFSFFPEISMNMSSSMTSVIFMLNQSYHLKLMLFIEENYWHDFLNFVKSQF